MNKLKILLILAIAFGLTACDKSKEEEPDYSAYNKAQNELNASLYADSDYCYNTDIAHIFGIMGGYLGVFEYQTAELPPLYTSILQRTPYQISALGATLTVTDVTNIWSAKLLELEEIGEYSEDIKLTMVEISDFEDFKDSEIINLPAEGGEVKGIGKIEKTACNQFKIIFDQNTDTKDSYIRLFISYSSPRPRPDNPDATIVPELDFFFKRLGLKSE